MCSVRRALSASTFCDAESMLLSEKMELLACIAEKDTAFNSLPPRGMCISLVIPKAFTHCTSATVWLDAFCALSDLKSSDETRVTTKVRFSIYGGDGSLPILKLLTQYAVECKSIHNVALVVHWYEETYDAPKVRCECFDLDLNSVKDGQNTSFYLQNCVMKMAKKHGINVPGIFWYPPPEAKEMYYENQIGACAQEICDLMHTEEQFRGNEVLRSENITLTVVPGAFVRISPIALWMDGVVSPDCIHGYLLCAVGKERDTLNFAKAHRFGLPSPEEVGAAELHLHTAAAQTERVHLNHSVTLFAHGGGCGQPIKADGNWIYKTKSAIVPLHVLKKDFFVFCCSLDSIIPGQPSLAPFMEVHLEKTTALLAHSLCKDEVSAAVTDTKTSFANTVKSEEKFVLAAFGLDLTSKRMLVGEALCFLHEFDATGSLVKLLTAVGSQVGLQTSLCGCFDTCTQALEDKEKVDSSAERESHPLRKASKRARGAVTAPTQKKIQMLLHAFGVRPYYWNPRLETSTEWKVNLPLDRESADNIVTAALITCLGHATCEFFNKLVSKVMTYDDIVAAMAFSLRVTLKKCSVAKRAFIVHRVDKGNPIIYEVGEGGVFEERSVGDAFECESPCFTVVRMKKRVCTITPMRQYDVEDPQALESVASRAAPK